MTQELDLDEIEEELTVNDVLSIFTALDPALKLADVLADMQVRVDDAERRAEAHMAWGKQMQKERDEVIKSAQELRHRVMEQNAQIEELQKQLLIIIKR